MLSGEDSNEKFGDSVIGRTCNFSVLRRCRGRSKAYPNEAAYALALDVKDVARAQSNSQLLASTEIARNAIQGHSAH